MSRPHTHRWEKISFLQLHSFFPKRSNKTTQNSTCGVQEETWGAEVALPGWEAQPRFFLIGDHLSASFLTLPPPLPHSRTWDNNTCFTRVVVRIQTSALNKCYFLPSTWWASFKKKKTSICSHLDVAATPFSPFQYQIPHHGKNYLQRVLTISYFQNTFSIR